MLFKTDNSLRHRKYLPFQKWSKIYCKCSRTWTGLFSIAPQSLHLNRWQANRAASEDMILRCDGLVLLSFINFREADLPFPLSCISFAYCCLLTSSRDRSFHNLVTPIIRWSLSLPLQLIRNNAQNISIGAYLINNSIRSLALLIHENEYQQQKNRSHEISLVWSLNSKSGFLNKLLQKTLRRF